MTMIRHFQLHFPRVEHQTIPITTPLIVEPKWFNITLGYLLSNARSFNGGQINVTGLGYLSDFIPNPIILDSIQSYVMFEMFQNALLIFEELVQFAQSQKVAPKESY